VNNVPTAPKMWVFFLVDRTGEMETQLTVFEKELNEMLDRVRRIDVPPRQLTAKAISMGTQTFAVDVQEGHLRLSETSAGCDLRLALLSVKEDIKNEQIAGDPRSPVALFLLLGAEPAAGWEQGVQTLLKLGVSFTTFPFGTRFTRETLSKLQSLGRTVKWPAPSTDPKSVKDAFELARGVLVRILENAPDARRAEASGEATVKLPPGPAARPAPAGAPSPPAVARGAATAAEVPVSPAEPPKLTKEGGVATIWRDIEPPKEMGDRVDPAAVQALSLPDGWQLIGASRRGKMHAHKGIFREDAFALGEKDGWHMLVVCDGGGSYSLARVGARVAAEAGVEAMSQVLSAPGDRTPVELGRAALEASLKEAWDALKAEADRRAVPLKELSTTFLAALHGQKGEEHLLGGVQVGDGLIVARLASGKWLELGEPDVGEVAGATLFLNSHPWKDWLDRVKVEKVDGLPGLLAAMCDGVADDFFPYEQHLGRLLDLLDKVAKQEQPERALLDLLEYEKRGSFDDRTVALLCPSRAASQPPAAASRVEPAVPKLAEPEARPAETAEIGKADLRRTEDAVPPRAAAGARAGDASPEAPRSG